MRNKIFRIFHFFITLALIGSVGFLFWRLQTAEEKIDLLGSTETSNVIQPADNNEKVQTSGNQTCTESCKNEINQIVSDAVSQIEIPESTKTETIVKETVTEAPSKSITTTYIPLGSSFSTTNTNWVDVPDSKIYIDLANDYSENAYVTWQASLKVAHANGKVSVRLFDETHGIAVDGSEISIENNAEYQTVSSSNLPLWRGNNLYKVQIKSLNSFEVFYSGGKVKIKY